MPACVGAGRAASAGRSSQAAGSASTGTARNTQRQPRCSTTSPLKAGPISEGTTQPAENAAKIFGRSACGYCRPTSTYSDTDSAPAPRPCTRRPAISIGMPIANPASSRPTTKQASPPHSAPAGPRRSHQRPATVMPTTLVASVLPKAKAYSGRPFSAVATVGIAAAMARASKALSETSATMPSVVAR